MWLKTKLKVILVIILQWRMSAGLQEPILNKGVPMGLTPKNQEMASKP